MFVCLCLLRKSKRLMTVRIKAISRLRLSTPSRVQANPAHRGSNLILSSARPFMPSLSVPRSYRFVSVPVQLHAFQCFSASAQVSAFALRIMPDHINSKSQLTNSVFHASLCYSTSFSRRSKSHQFQLESASGLFVSVLINAFPHRVSPLLFPNQILALPVPIVPSPRRFQAFPCLFASLNVRPCASAQRHFCADLFPFKSVLIHVSSLQFSSSSCPIHSRSRLLSSEQIPLTALRVIAASLAFPSFPLRCCAPPYLSSPDQCVAGCSQLIRCRASPCSSLSGPSNSIPAQCRSMLFPVIANLSPCASHQCNSMSVRLMSV